MKRFFFILILLSMTFLSGQTAISRAQSTAGYSGTITAGGAPLANTTVSLRYFNGSSWLTYQTATTGSNGSYHFATTPVLSSASQQFYVFWENSGQNDNYLASWLCWPVTTSTLTFEDFRCDFDVSDVKLLSPTPGASVSLPATFSWQKRNVAGDDYELNVADLNNNSFWWWSYPSLGDETRFTFTLANLPPEFQAGAPYAWWLWVYGPDGVGSSYYYRNVTFTRAAHRTYLPGVLSRTSQAAPVDRSRYQGRVTEGGQPAGNVALTLHFFNGETWQVHDQTSTDAAGRYRFNSLPGLQDNQFFYVEWDNSEENDRRLSAWACWPVTVATKEYDDHRCNFDLKNITLSSPAPGAAVSLPHTFRWNRRGIPGDVYEFNLMDPNHLDTWWWTDPPLGDTGQYRLDGLPAGFIPGASYGWWLWLYAPDGYGLSYYYYPVSFTGAAGSPAGTPGVQPRPAAGLLEGIRLPTLPGAPPPPTPERRPALPGGTAGELPAPGLPSNIPPDSQALSTPFAHYQPRGSNRSAGGSSRPEVFFTLRGGLIAPNFILQSIVRPARSDASAIAYQQEKHFNGQWIFMDDGTFIFRPGIPLRQDLYPVVGIWTYNQAEDVVVLAGRSAAAYGGNASSYAEIGAVLLSDNGQLWLFVTEEVSAVQAAVVSGLSFGSSSFKYFNFWLPVSP